jgi:hypothetical protein
MRGRRSRPFETATATSARTCPAPPPPAPAVRELKLRGLADAEHERQLVEAHSSRIRPTSKARAHSSAASVGALVCRSLRCTRAGVRDRLNAPRVAGDGEILGQRNRTLGRSSRGILFGSVAFYLSLIPDLPWFNTNAEVSVYPVLGPRGARCLSLTYCGSLIASGAHSLAAVLPPPSRQASCAPRPAE